MDTRSEHEDNEMEDFDDDIDRPNDIGISAQYYSWLKFVGLQLRACAKCDSDERTFSISLYTPRVIETSNVPRMPLFRDEYHLPIGDVFMFEVPCSWGSAFSSVHWNEAWPYFERRLQEERVYPPIAQSRVDGWTGSWKKWLIELGFWEHWSTIYPNFRNQTAFSTNLLSAGSHIRAVDAETIRNYTTPLFQDNRWYHELNRKRMFEGSIKRLNLFNNIIHL